jgi:hypothetical protein
MTKSSHLRGSKDWLEPLVGGRRVMMCVFGCVQDLISDLLRLLLPEPTDIVVVVVVVVVV